MAEITELLQAWNKGDTEALNKLVPLVDHELKKIAHNYMHNERAGHILQTTALVNEALIKLIRENVSWENRQQFYGFIAKRMRQVLIDYVRRTPNAQYVDINNVTMSDEKSRELIRLDEVLKELAELDERKATMVECRFFIGLTIPETAKLLGIATTTVERDWQFTRAWLERKMTE